MPMLRHGRHALAIAPLLLVGCSPATEKRTVISGEEARQLNEAAAMLDANRIDADLAENESESE